MLKITIHDDTNPQAKNQGKILEQKVWVHLPDSAFPKESTVSQWKDRETGQLPFPYPKGEYTFDETSFRVDGKNFNRLVVDLKLVPIAKPSAVSKA